MNLRDARIGYGAYSRDFSAPGDRRRFAAYARIKGLAVDYARLGAEYDLAYVTYSSDLPGWIARKERDGDRLKLVFELVDSYFTETGIARRFLKGTGRRLLGTDSRLSPDLRRTLLRACEVADAVVCATDEQRAVISEFNANVFTSFDHFGDELGAAKNQYGRADKLDLVWEGQSTTLPNLRTVREPINDLRDRVALHVVTDPIAYRYFGRFGAVQSRRLLDGFECETHFHPWEASSFAAHIKRADLAIIPIDRTNALSWGKPANKLVMFWQLGMPVLTSATPAYERAMTSAGMDMTCATPAEWGPKLERLIAADGKDLEGIGQAARDHACQAYSRDKFVDRFDQALAAVGMGMR